MKERVGTVLGRPIRDFGRLDQPWPTICTFHSLCLRILRHYADAGRPAGQLHDLRLGRPDEARSRKRSRRWTFPAPISRPAASTARSATRRTSSHAPRSSPSRPATSTSGRWRGSTRSTRSCCTQNNALDFDDLLLQTAHAFRDHPRRAGGAAGAVSVHPDRRVPGHEPRPVHPRPRAGACGTGTSASSATRTSRSTPGAGRTSRTSSTSRSDYPDAKVVRLEQNYRSTKTILAIASQLIAQQHAAEGQGALDRERRRATRPSCSSARTSTTRRRSSSSS